MEKTENGQGKVKEFSEGLLLDILSDLNFSDISKEIICEKCTWNDVYKTSTILFRTRWLTHFPRIYVSVNRVSIASDNGLSLIRRQAII